MRYFFYGTLLDPDVRAHILGPWIDRRTLPRARLPGYRRVYIRGRSYPVAVPAPGASVDGVLAEGLDRRAVRRLACFESDEYVDAERTVAVDGGRTLRARVFVAGRLARPSRTPWTIEAWQRCHKAGFARRRRVPLRRMQRSRMDEDNRINRQWEKTMAGPKVSKDDVMNACAGMLQKQLYVVATTPTDGLGPVMENLEEHLKFQVSLEERGIMFGAGPFWNDDETEWLGEGMVIIRAGSLAEAKEIAASDPMHSSGARSFTVRPWLMNEGTVTVKIRYSDGSREVI